MSERLLGLPLLSNDRQSATLYLGALAFPDDRGEFECFYESVRLCATSPRKLDRARRRCIDRAGEAIYELRIPAAMVASALEGRMSRAITAGMALQVHTALDTVQKAIAYYAPRAPKYRNPRDFRRHVWNTSLPVLHLAIAFKILVLRDKALPLLPLIANPHWVEAAARSARFHAEMLRKCIDGLEFVTLRNENINAELLVGLGPDVRYRRSGNWGDLTDD